MQQELFLNFSDTKAKTGFEISIEYSFLEFTGLVEGEKQIAEFLHEIFLVNVRDIYDLELTEATEGKPIFAVPAHCMKCTVV
jgi:hypothetical protein